jgi:hypothetical protein
VFICFFDLVGSGFRSTVSTLKLNKSVFLQVNEVNADFLPMQTSSPNKTTQLGLQAPSHDVVFPLFWKSVLGKNVHMCSVDTRHAHARRWTCARTTGPVLVMLAYEIDTTVTSYDLGPIVLLY